MLERNLFAGFGGQGMLLMGEILAMSGMLEDKYVSWLPSYGPEMRGGTANCSVVISDKPIASPVITQANCVVAMNRPSLDKFEKTVKPGGLLIVNSSLVDIQAQRNDIEVYYVPANELAEKLGSPQVANMVMLGAYLEKKPVVLLDSIVTALLKKVGQKRAHLVDVNKAALSAGAEIIKETY